MSVNAGIGGGKGQEQVESPAANALMDLARTFATETTGVRTGLVNAMQEVLSTGGSKLPIISRSVEASRREGSKALQGTKDENARTGLSGTPFGSQILATQRREGNIAAGKTEQSLAQAILNMIPNFVLGQSQTALSGLSGAIPGMNTTNAKGMSTGTSMGGKN